MMSTALAALVLSGMAVSTASQPSWQTDYATAIARAAESQKPIAVFIAHGGAGYARVIANGSLPSDATRVLRQSYVCLYVDTDTVGGRQLAQAFEMSEGLVISGKAGAKQALRHNGKVSQTELTNYLMRYAVADYVMTTETPNAVMQAVPAYVPPAPTYYPPARPVASNCST